MKVRNPRTGALDYEIAPLGDGALRAVEQDLRGRQRAWAALPFQQRAGVLEAFASAIEAQATAIAGALEIDTGRRAISRIEVTASIAAIRRWAGRAEGVVTGAYPAAAATSVPGITARTRLIPYPLVGVISPWNFPLTLALIDAIPALAAGCAVIVKPSEVTPRFIAPLIAAIPAELPLAVIEGDGKTGEALVPLVNYIAFTGSVTTGRKVAAAAAHAMIPASLELGGKDAMIVLASADPVRAAEVALRASIVNSGQACQSIERVYVARAIAEAFLTALTEQAAAVRLNDVDIGQGDIGPFIFEQQATIVQAQLDDALAQGATIHTGGRVETLGGGLYLRPTVVSGVTPDMALMREETFGPVVPVTLFGTIDEAVELANSGDFGLSAAVLAGTAEEAEAVGERLCAGGISINDGSLTAFVWEAEKSSFGTSGLGASRMGDSGILRFFRRQAIIRQTDRPLPIAAYAEDAPR
ncbi:Aldehyde dehydrogenase family protein [Sphingomonas antarctica]|uniref:aldehyde dehydrogenase family protein n=1 Tax=Sphingomonas antarctica TaxID=2040274 RepID=UPI0039EC927D